jgi:hypothetical protein
VSWRATASSSTVESNARRFLPRTAPVSTTSSRTTSKIRCGRTLSANLRRQYVNVDGWNAAASTATPHAAFHRRSNVTASAASRSDSPCNVCSTSTEATTSGAIEGRPRPEGNKSSNIARREQPVPTLSQQREHTAHRQQMPRHRLHIQQIPLILRPSLHGLNDPEVSPPRAGGALCSAVS